MSKRSYDKFNSEHIEEFEKKKRFKGMLKSNEFKCYNKYVSVFSVTLFQR